MEAEFIGPPLPPNLQKQGQVSDPLRGGVSEHDSDHNYHKKGAKPKKHKGKRRHKSVKYISSSLKESDFHPQLLKSFTGEHPVKSKDESQEAHKPMTFGDLK